jgi:uncharacterized protein (DUF58 family)
MARTKSRSTRTRLTRRGRIFAGAGVGLFIVAFASGNRILLLGGILALILVAAALIMVRARRLQLNATRTFYPPIVEVGGRTRATVVIENVARAASSAALWYDTLPWEPGYTVPEYLPSLGAHRERFSHPRTKSNLGYSVEPPRRGVFAIGPIEVETGDPFSLATGTAVLAGTHELIVTPRITELPGKGLSIDAADGAAHIVQRAATGSEDDLMTREYRRGDALRRVHWRASARHGELMVRQEEPRNRPEARIIIDTRSDGYPDASSEAPGPGDLEPESESFEWIIGFVASMSLHLQGSGYAVSVLETAGAQLVQPRGGAVMDATPEEFLRSLAAAQLVRDDLAALPDGVQGPDGGRAPVFALVAAPSRSTVDWITRMRRPYETGTVVILGGSLLGEHDSGVPFEKAGWTCIRVSLDSRPSDVWPLVAAGSHGGVRVN